MISYDEALKIIRNAAAKKMQACETVPLNEISGRVCFDDIVSPVANQPFDNSAMDGFALRAEDLAQAANDNPVVLEMVGHIAAGDSARFKPPGRGQCYEIMTGASLPPGCDSIVPVERTEKKAGNKILFRAVPAKGENIRRAGEDFKAGDVVVRKAAILNSGHILTLATLGISSVKVLKKPRVALISTGREIVDDLNARLAPGQIYNSTGPYLAAALAELGTEIKCGGNSVPDDPQAFKSKLSAMIREGIDIGVSTGAVSAGVHDFIPSVLKEMGAEILFHKVAIRPGKPILFAYFPRSGTFFAGLPGNPASSAVGLRFFIRPLIRALQGLEPESPCYALLKIPYTGGKNGLRLFLRGNLHHTDKTTHEIEIIPGQQSFKVRPFVDANAWAVIPESAESLNTGDIVEVYP